jgi:PAS domain S-box-containing protein
MHWQYTPYIFPLCVAAAVSVTLALFTWRRRSAPGAITLVWLMLAVAVWTLLYALRLSSVDLATKLFWAKARYLGIVVTPTAWSLFALQYTGREKWLTRRNLALLAIEPLCVLLVVWTNDWHGLYWSSTRLEQVGSLVILETTHGVAFWLHTAYSYMLLLAGTFLYLQTLARSPRPYRGQSLALLVGALAPLAVHVIDILGLNPFPHLNPTPFAFVLAGIALFWGLFRFRLLDIVPVARSAVVASIPDGVIVLDDQNRIVELNPAAERIVGHPAAEVIGKPATQILSALHDLIVRYHDVTEAQVEIVLEAEGNQRTFDLRISALRNRRGHLTGRLLILRDVTERKRVREALEQRAVQLAALNRIGRHIASIFDLHELFQHAVDAVREDLGYLQAAILLMEEQTGELYVAAATDNFWEIIPENYRQIVGRGAIGTAAETGETVLVQDASSDPRVYRVGDYLSPSSLSVPIKVGERVIGVFEVEANVPNAFDENDVMVMNTLSDQVAVAAENARLYAEAQQSRKAAEVASQAKSDFLANVSHELRTPLTSVLGFAKIIKKRLHDVIFPVVVSDDRKVQRAIRQVGSNVDIIVSEGERLTALINDVLDLAKIEAGKIKWDMQPVSVTEIIERAVAATAPLFESKPLKMVIEVEEGLPAIVGDHARLVQVLVNLLSNAAKFTGEGSVTCRARLAGDEIVVSVIDTGIGIATGDYEKVFERFAQVSDVLTYKPQGTGLGLPICKNIVEHHGGRIWVESELGVGSTFTFVLPLAPGEMTEPEPPALDEVRRRVIETLPAEGKGRLILVVDDEENVRNLLRQELAEADYQVIEAASGSEALDMARQEKPALIILDVMMPGISGFDVTSVLRADPSTADIPILILSIVEDKEAGLRLGADEYLTKPLDTERLLRTIAALLARAERG